MKLLIDENLPKVQKQHLSGHEVYTVRDMGWQSKKNGELLALMIAQQSDVLITFDKNLRHQQNFDKYSIAVFVLNTIRDAYPFLEPLLPYLKALNNPLQEGAIIISSTQ